MFDLRKEIKKLKKKSILLIQWINGNQVLKHAIGHLPFEAEITDYVEVGTENRITVLCDNALDQTTVPQGRIVETQKYLF